MIYCDICESDTVEVVSSDVEKGIEFTIITEHCKCNYCKSTFDVVNTKRVINKVAGQFHTYQTLHFQFIEEFQYMIDNYVTSNTHFGTETKKMVNHIKRQFTNRMNIDYDELEKEFEKQFSEDSTRGLEND